MTAVIGEALAGGAAEEGLVGGLGRRGMFNEGAQSGSGGGLLGFSHNIPLIEPQKGPLNDVEGLAHGTLSPNHL